MITLPVGDFLQWSRTKGLELDSRYPHSAVLAFTTGCDSRFWCIPPDPRQRPHFISSMLDLMGEWKTCYAWRHLGTWPDSVAGAGNTANSRVERFISRKIGLPPGSTEVIAFDRGEYDALLTLLFITTCFGWSVNDDLYIVPDHAEHMIQTDHHDVIHGEFRSEKEVERWVAGMSAQGFDLPDELPDWTFKRPKWM